jgi:hypothetical protein
MSTSRTQRDVVITLVVLLLLVVVINLIARALDSAVGGSEPGGARGSSYATNGTGLSAYAQLLADYGHPVQRQRGNLGSRALDPRALLILTGSDRPEPLRPDELATITTFLDQGGHAVLVEVRAQDVQAITGIAPDVVGGVRDYHEFAPDLGDLRTVRTDGAFSYAPHRDLTVLVSQSDRALLVSTRENVGDVRLLAEATPLQNAAIGEADNAAFGLALPAADQPVVFAEGVHGYGQRSGLAAIPARWKAGLGLLGLAAILFAWSRARRLGPPDRPDRELPPARSRYVDAMADTLEHTHERARALAPLGEWARNRVKVGAGLPPDADRDAVTAAARRLGLSDAEIVTLWQPPVDDDEVLALGRVATRVTDERTQR